MWDHMVVVWVMGSYGVGPMVWALWCGLWVLWYGLWVLWYGYCDITDGNMGPFCIGFYTVFFDRLENNLQKSVYFIW